MNNEGEARSRPLTATPGPGGAACPVIRSAQRRVKATLRYPLPDWAVDTPCRYGLTLTVANAIGKEVEHWPSFTGPTALQDYARHVTRAVLDSLNPGLAWLTWLTGVTDGFSYPGDEIVSYISQLALTRYDEAPDTEHYRELLRNYSWYLFEKTRSRRLLRGMRRAGTSPVRHSGLGLSFCSRTSVRANPTAREALKNAIRLSAAHRDQHSVTDNDPANPRGPYPTTGRT